MPVYEHKANLNQLESPKSSVLTSLTCLNNDILSAVVKHPMPDSETLKSLSAGNLTCLEMP